MEVTSNHGACLCSWTTHHVGPRDGVYLHCFSAEFPQPWHFKMVLKDAHQVSKSCHSYTVPFYWFHELGFQVRFHLKKRFLLFKKKIHLFLDIYFLFFLTTKVMYKHYRKFRKCKVTEGNTFSLPINNYLLIFVWVHLIICIYVHLIKYIHAYMNIIILLKF